MRLRLPAASSSAKRPVDTCSCSSCQKNGVELRTCPQCAPRRAHQPRASYAKMTNLGPQTATIAGSAGPASESSAYGCLRKYGCSHPLHGDGALQRMAQVQDWHVASRLQALRPGALQVRLLCYCLYAKRAPRCFMVRGACRRMLCCSHTLQTPTQQLHPGKHHR